MEIIRIADINDRYEIEKLIKVMLGDENPDEVAKSLVDSFFMDSESYVVYVIEILNLVKGFCVVKFNPSSCGFCNSNPFVIG
jgi:hypothetical protein